MGGEALRPTEAETIGRQHRFGGLVPLVSLLMLTSGRPKWRRLI